MGVRFASFETYKPMLADKETGALTDKAILAAGLAAGVTEAVTVVTPMEVLKVRLQGQSHSFADGATGPKYRNVAHAVYVICREEGFFALYNGVFLTALRQGTNQAVNLTVYTKLKQFLRESQPAYSNADLPAYQTALCGLVAGGSGPLFNAPIDTLKTRVQQSPMKPGETGLTHILHIARDMFKQEGYHALYKGVTPRILRVGPGQALTYTGYEFFKGKLQPLKEYLSS
ncbi:mitochondrial carrier [Xylona heveae TC161]|uniref:Mitochondrial carrier n=1 Tax=Xylona heveae (strain CBS 132557 / TC161) TaxID=1328760 RepID=A0A165H7K3_XYLHT|nr:mitochondrial carrier [Xylona heveae TC161]KZF23095.1 mitochondrial carrier [Xylona heveae TC161]